jgi:hypothetical protein
MQPKLITNRKLSVIFSYFMFFKTVKDTPEAINLFNDMIDTVANKRGEIEDQEKKELL